MFEKAGVPVPWCNFALRLDLEAQHRSVARNAPLFLGLLPLGAPPPSSRTRLVAQLGAAF